MGADEVDFRPVHPLISHVPVPQMDTEDALLLDPKSDNEYLVRGLRAICQTREPTGASELHGPWQAAYDQPR